MKKIILGTLIISVIAVAAILQKLGLQNSQTNNSTIPTNSNSNQTSNSPTTQPSQGSSYKDGQYTGKVTDAFYGNYQVAVTISNGKISDVQFLQYPNDVPHSQEVSAFANPALKQEAITSQNANVDIVSGATQTSIAFRQSLQSALDKAI